ncbi:MAG: hypothetical protein ACD_28C00423G0003 [uncultured bacterium]|nr:MAG: hypothetical protein ACD_28C00423G0003 [uncultured bacterium]
MSKQEGPSLLRSDQQEGYFNRESPPGLFDCAVRGHTGHDAQVFVEFGTYEGTEFLPTCAAGAASVIDELRRSIGPHGVRWVGEAPVMVASGKINGTLSSR